MAAAPFDPSHARVERPFARRARVTVKNACFLRQARAMTGAGRTRARVRSWLTRVGTKLCVGYDYISTVSRRVHELAID